VTLQFTLQVIAVFLGGGSVQLLIAFMRRKPDARKLHTAADVDEATVFEKRSTAQDRLIDQLQEDGDTLRSQIALLEAKVERMEARLVEAHREFAGQLEVANAENARLRVRNAQLDSDLAIVTRQRDDFRDDQRRRQRLDP
jgi:predicted RNase H-like nuclease (RuvC/YqgF family)